MERRGCGPGCIVLALGLVLSCCLLPYFVSSIYSIVGAVLQVEGIPNWLWGDVLGTVVGADSALYMMLAEGPICCVGTLALLAIITGLVMLISTTGRKEEEDLEGEYAEYQDYEAHEDFEEPDQTVSYTP